MQNFRKILAVICTGMAGFSTTSPNCGDSTPDEGCHTGERCCPRFEQPADYRGNCYGSRFPKQRNGDGR